MDSITRAQGRLQAQLIKADPADEIDVAVDLMIHLPPESKDMDAARHHFSEMRAFCGVNILMEPLRVILTRKFNDLRLCNGALGRFPPLA